jgi:holliday junction DNA helicase RuvA
MIGKLTGEFGGISNDGIALLEVGGVGYAVRVPTSAIAAMPSGTPLCLFIHTAVREDAIDLYGFPTPGELNFFKLLCSVSGIGPKSALGILNIADVPTLARAIARGDASALTKVFGIGKKSGERIVVELRDKMGDALIGSSPSSLEASDDADVLEALMALGYSAAESRAAVKEVSAESRSMRERLSAALQYLGGAKVPARTA